MQTEEKSNENDELHIFSSPNIFPFKPSITTLNISLYPWASSQHLEQYRRVVEHYWYNVLDNKHVHLNWLPETDWDGGYVKIPQTNFDIFIYDTMFMDHYISQGWLSALNRNDLTYAHEISPNILSLIECDNGKYYGIPIYACIYVLFYRSNDKELAAVKSFEELIEIASKRHFIMRKPGRTQKTLNYLTSLGGENNQMNSITEENLNINLINRLSYFYKHSKYLLDDTDQYLFEQSSFYIGFTEDLNTRLIVDENDLSQIEFMLVPLNNQKQTQCWLDCVGINPQTKLRGTYEKSLQLANLMTCSNVMNDCLKGQLYVIPTNHVTLSRLATNNSIYAKLQTLIESNIFRPSYSLPVIINSAILAQEQWSQAMALVLAQHQKEMQSMANTSTAPS